MPPPEQRRVRASRPKTKTGCKTCKIRRLKCGEEKPECLRCVKFGFSCDGYVTKSGTMPKPPLRALAPRTASSAPLLAPSMVNLPFASFFKNGMEYMYFLNYQEEAALELSGPFDSCLWNRVVLQACQSEPSLCRLATAIGALNRSLKLRTSLSSGHESCLHETYALSEYGKALIGIQKMISGPRRRDTTRLALISSLLIFCFENMHGEFDLAIMHMKSALNLMNKQLSKTMCKYKHLKTLSPTPDLENEIVTAFVRMDCHLLSRTDNSESRRMGSEVVRKCILGIDWNAEAYDVPARFLSIDQARNFLEHMQFRLLPKLAHEFDVHISDNSAEYATDFGKEYSEQSNKWRSAFAPLYAEACKLRKGKDFVAAATLRVSRLSTEIIANRMATPGKVATDFYEYESREIINLSRRIITDSTIQKSFTFDGGIVPSLFIVIVICENMELRKEAFELLKQTVPRREGAWDSATLVAVATHVLHIATAGAHTNIVETSLTIETCIVEEQVKSPLVLYSEGL